jgi:uncharacterized protein
MNAESACVVVLALAGQSRHVGGREKRSMTVASILWRRLDTPGHDACRLEKRDAGWQLEGTAVFRQGELPARLTYAVSCDLSWQTQHGHVYGWIGSRSIEISVERTAERGWTLNGGGVEGLASCLDLDFGFTPATNLLQLRRLALREGCAVDAPVAWLDVSAGTLEVLHQRYERRGEATYWYEARRFSYAALLEVTATGFVRRYPGLWEADANPEAAAQPAVSDGPQPPIPTPA